MNELRVRPNMSNKQGKTHMLRIVILTAQHVAARWAGDFVQACKTAEALRGPGVAVEHVIYSDYDQEAMLPSGARVRNLSSSLPAADVLHFIPGRLTHSQYKRWIGSLNQKPLVVGSTIYWDSKIHRTVVRNNRCTGTLAELKAALHSRFRKPRCYFSCFDLLLANSQAEVSVCMRILKMKKGAMVASVPNGIDPIPSWAWDLEPLQGLVPGGYILYPGVFSPRKNQLGFINAMRGCEYPVVFMGGSLHGAECEHYYQKCRAAASSTFHFVGHVDHRSHQFYSLLRNARVAVLASSCETPGLAVLEAASLGARPAITREGGAMEYLGFDAEYLNPLDPSDIKGAVTRAWGRGRLSKDTAKRISGFTWEEAARQTLFYYRQLLH